MPRYAAFLRGINVGGHRVKSGELCSHLEALGLSEVAAFRASGNVVFEAGKEPRAALTARIEEGLQNSLGYAVKTFLRTASEVRGIAGHEPFDPALVEASRGKVQVAMLPKPAPKGAQAKVTALATAEDRLAFGGRELYWLPSGGIMESDLDLATIERLVGPTTMRTKGTVDQLAAKYFG